MNAVNPVFPIVDSNFGDRCGGLDARSYFISGANFHEGPLRQNGSASKSSAAPAIEMRSDTERIDFNSYLRDVYLSVTKRWFVNMPPSLEKGRQGTNSVEFHVLQDGNVSKDSLKDGCYSGRSDFDAASLEGIQDAAPFNRGPEKFSAPFIILRFTFYYNLPRPRN
jgi:hypothetical protein